jgi:hypothetical protein
MITDISGGHKSQRKLVSDVADFMYEKYLKRYTSLFVSIAITKNLVRDEDMDGSCLALDFSRPREFEILVDSKLPTKCFIKTVIHEFIHVKQYATGELTERYRGLAKRTWKNTDHTRTPYSKQPWEREAYRLQESLYKEFMSWSKK